MKNLANEWSWHYASGVLKDPDGVEYAIHVSTFEMGGHQSTHAAVRTRDGAMVSAELQAGGVDARGISFRAEGLELVIALYAPTVVSVAPPDRASSKTHSCAPSTFAYGSMKIDGKVVDVEGTLWYDREELLSGDSPAWDWASIRLDNGLRLYVYALDGSRPYAVSIDDVTLEPKRYDDVVVVEHDSYLSGTGRLYATDIEVRVAGYGTFFLRPWFEEQEIVNSITPYYEGVCDVLERGRRVGSAFVEYVGRRVVTEEDLLTRWCRGDAEAAVALRDLAYGSQLADDFVDKDISEFKNDKSGHMLDFLTIALARLPNNRFYQKHRATLEPLVVSSLLYWDLSNYLVTLKNDNSRYYAYAYRELLEQVVGLVAYTLGGLEFARRTLREVHRYYHVINVDPFGDWWAEVSNV